MEVLNYNPVNHTKPLLIHKSFGGLGIIDLSLGSLIAKNTSDIIFTSHNGNVTIFSSELKDFIAKNIIKNLNIQNIDISQTTEKELKDELNKLKNQITESENNINILKDEYERKTVKIGCFHKENIIKMTLSQNTDEGVLDLNINSQLEIESLIIITDFDYEVIMDDQLFI